MEIPEGIFNLSHFLEEAELKQYHDGFRNVLKVMNISQLKYVTNDDLEQLGMSRPEQRRFRKIYNKHFPNRYIYKIKRLFKPSKRYDMKPELVQVRALLDTTNIPQETINIKVPGKHIIPVEDITINKELGVGEFGVVQQGIWTSDNQRIQVAIKCLGRERMHTNSMEFLKEAAVMHSIEHAHVVRLYGVVLHPDSLMLVTELAPLRSLLECLKEFSLRQNFTVLTLCDFALQICNGMTYLENKRLIHRDLAARNILVFSKNKVKISDFGLSRALGVGKDYYQTNYNVNLKLPIAWCAPECITYLRFTSSSDVWAYAVTLWEMFSYGFQPWPALSGQEILTAIDEPNFQRLEQPECCPDSFYSLMLNCWSHSPCNRPNFSEIEANLPLLIPEQVEAITNSTKEGNLLEFQRGDLITVLSKNGPGDLYKGILKNGKTGFFSPHHTTKYECTNSIKRLNTKTHSTPSSPEPSTSGLRPRASSSIFCSSLMGSLRRSDVTRFFPKKKSPQLSVEGNQFLETTNMAVVSPFRPNDLDEEQPLLNPNSPSHLTGEASSPPPYPLLTNNKTIDAKRNDDTPSFLKLKFPHKVKSFSAPGSSTSLKVEDGPHEYHEISETQNGTQGFGESMMQEIDSMFRSLNPDFKNSTERRSARKEAEFKLKSLSLGKNPKSDLVQRISPHDEKTLEAAISLTKELTAKSMNDLNGPKTPTTPKNEKHKITFRFPTLSSHDKETSKFELRNFTEEAKSIPDLQATITEESREAYNSLIEKKPLNYVKPSTIHPTQDEVVSIPADISNFKSLPKVNPLPVPPRDRTKKLIDDKPRHIRKYPLALPSYNLQVQSGPEHIYANNSSAVSASTLKSKRRVPPPPPITNMISAELPSYQNIQIAPVGGRGGKDVPDGIQSTLPLNLNPFKNDCIIQNPTLVTDDHIPLKDSVSTEDLLEFSGRKPNGRQRGAESDEVRIMKKVISQDISTEDCLQALDLCDWNIFTAVKIIRLKNEIKEKASLAICSFILSEANGDVGKATLMINKQQDTVH